MALQVSTGFKTLILGPQAFEAIFRGGVIRVFTGTQPLTADHAEHGAYLGSITQNGFPVSMGALAGLTYEQNGPYITAAPDGNWTLGVEHPGTAGWFRIIGAASDGGDVSYSLPRIDGTIKADGTAELRLPSTTLTAGDVVGPLNFLFTIPPLVGG